MSFKDIENQEEELNQLLQEEFNLNEEDLKKIDALNPSSSLESKGLITMFFSILKDDLLRPLRQHKIKKLYSNQFNIPPDHVSQLITIAQRKSLLHRRFALLNQIQRLFHYWHVFHKPFAIIMYIIMFVHIGVAIWLGYTWTL